MIKDSLQRVYEKLRRDDLPELEPGDTERVNVKIRQADKERLQAFEGV